MLEVKNVVKTFQTPSGPVHALKDVTFSVATGSFVSIVGKSGSGKSTLLSILGALDTPSSGTITVDDMQIEKLSGHRQTQYRGKKIGFVFQQYNLVPNLTALENVMLALEFGAIPRVVVPTELPNCLNRSESKKTRCIAVQRGSVVASSNASVLPGRSPMNLRSFWQMSRQETSIALLERRFLISCMISRENNTLPWWW